MVLFREYKMFIELLQRSFAKQKKSKVNKTKEGD